MKKVIVSLLLLAGCAVVDTPSQKAEYVEKDGGCMYVEYFGAYGDNIFGTKEIFNVKRRNSVMYPNTSCRNVIDADLKTGVNKNIIK